MNIFAILPWVATIIGIATVVTLRPNLRVTMNIIKKTGGSVELPNQFMIGLTVENNGAFDVQYQVMNQAEQKFILTKIKPDVLPIGISIQKTQAGIYQERVFDIAMPSHNPQKEYSSWVNAYEVKHILKAGSRTDNNLHIVGNFALKELKHIDYDSSIARPQFMSSVQVRPSGAFWGLPLLRKLNTRTLYFTDATLLVEAVDKL
jgi:hypothetical protein